MARAHEPDPIFLRDEEIARRESMMPSRWEALRFAKAVLARHDTFRQEIAKEAEGST